MCKVYYIGEYIKSDQEGFCDVWEFWVALPITLQPPLVVFTALMDVMWEIKSLFIRVQCGLLIAGVWCLLYLYRQGLGSGYIPSGEALPVEQLQPESLYSGRGGNTDELPSSARPRPVGGTTGMSLRALLEIQCWYQMCEFHYMSQYKVYYTQYVAISGILYATYMSVHRCPATSFNPRWSDRSCRWQAAAWWVKLEPVSWGRQQAR